MRLDELVAEVGARHALGTMTITGDQHRDVATCAHDSRQVTAGSLYCCVPGAVHDGHRFAPAAVQAGAAALLVERPLGLDVPEVVVGSVRAAMGPVAAALAGNPSDRLEVVGITGTNGKTTTAHLLAQVLATSERRYRVIGTLTGARTTPEAPELQALLAEAEAEGAAGVVMEVSSHALDLHRVDGTRFRVGVFTNLSQDHLDHHGTMEAYFAAKARLFTPALCDLAVVNVDDVHGRLLADTVEVPVLTYSLDQAHELQMGAAGSTFRWNGVDVTIPLAGRFNVSNALAAATVATALGRSPEAVAAALAGAERVSGRFEQVDVGQGYLAVVDYAHTPDGLREALEAARELSAGRVIVVFGAGGDRDPGKRPQMGAAAADLADLVILTTDNPRSEDPAAIIEAVRHGIPASTDLLIEPDRRLAIAAAVAEARAGDVLVVAGKGHETTQIVGTVASPFDDRRVLAEAIASTHGGGGR